jgi:DNA-binding NarL/FixJ family response regulator
MSQKSSEADDIRVAMLDDHQSIIDGYQFRLGRYPQINVVGAISFGCDLEPLLAAAEVDVLILDVSVPTSPENRNPYPILYLIPQLLRRYPRLAILVISMHADRPLIRALIEAGISGYILKDDHATLRNLGAVVLTVAAGGVFYSAQAHDAVWQQPGDEPALTERQLEVLSLFAAYPDFSSADAARTLGVAESTVRNLSSNAYFRLGVRTRTAAVARARQLGLITPIVPPAESSA